MDYQNELTVALEIVAQASHLARRIQAQMISPALSKSDRSPVTVADFAIQALVARRLMLAFPQEGGTDHAGRTDHAGYADQAMLMAEEDSSTLRGTPLLERVTAFVSGTLAPGAPREVTPDAVCEWIDRGALGKPGAGSSPAPQRYWMLDPIDGTKGFLRGGQYAIALALLVGGEVQVGVLGCPELSLQGLGPGILAYAARGQGAWAIPLRQDDEAVPASAPLPLRVSARADPAEARLLRSFEAGHTNVVQIEQFASVLSVQAEPVPMDSQAKYALLAAGEGDIILRLLSADQPDYREKAWDQAAGSIVVEEAGGRVTDLSGRPFDFTAGRELVRNRGVLVSNGRLHDVALRALANIGA